MNEEMKNFIKFYTHGISSIATANALTYLREGIKACRNLKIPEKPLYLKQDTDDIKYREPTTKELLEYLEIYLKEAIEQLDKERAEL